MEISKFKNCVEHNSFDRLSFVLVAEDIDTNLIIDQYVDIMCSNNNLKKKFIESLNDIPDASFIADDHLYIMKQDKFDDVLNADNCIVVCKSSKNREAIKIPKLQDWQVVDYALSIAKGLDKNSLEWLIPRYCGNHMMFINDILKLSYFNESSQRIVFDNMARSGEFDAISNITIFDLTNAIIKKDRKTVADALKVKDFVDITPMHFITILSNSFRNIINIQLNPNCTCQELGISDKQFFVIKKYNCGYYDRDQLVKIMELLSNIEYKFKYEELPVSSIIDYLTVNILGV